MLDLQAPVLTLPLGAVMAAVMDDRPVVWTCAAAPDADAERDATRAAGATRPGRWCWSGAWRPSPTRSPRRWRLPQAPARVLLETGGLTPWLWHEFGARSWLVHCIDARRANAQPALRPAKRDRSDARGLAEITRTGWYANLRVKGLDHHAVRAKLAARAQAATQERPRLPD